MFAMVRDFIGAAVFVAALWFQADSAALYDEGRQALDRGEWQSAVDAFERMPTDGANADAAVYWRAYAHNKMGDVNRTLDLISELEERYPESEWRDDARALAAEVRRPSARGSGGDEELKLMALNALMHSGDEEALPILEEFLRGDHSSRLKERALFILAQSGKDAAYDILADIARNPATPELQRKALRYLGVHHSEASLQILVELYGALDDVEARAAILRSFMIAGEKDRLLELAREEPNEELRGRAIRLLGTMDATDELWTLYERESSTDVRRRILQGFMVAGDSQRLEAVARDEGEDVELRMAAVQLLGAQDAKDALWSLFQQTSSEPLREKILHGLFVAGDTERLALVARDASASLALRKAAIHHLGTTGDETRSTLKAIYASEESVEIKERVLHSLFIQDDVLDLVEIARAEDNLELKKRAVHWLSVMDAPEAKAFMMELLRQ